MGRLYRDLVGLSLYIHRGLRLCLLLWLLWCLWGGQLLLLFRGLWCHIHEGGWSRSSWQDICNDLFLDQKGVQVGMFSLLFSRESSCSVLVKRICNEICQNRLLRFVKVNTIMEENSQSACSTNLQSMSIPGGRCKIRQCLSASFRTLTRNWVPS